MQWDREDADDRARHRDQALARYVRHDLSYAPHYRQALSRVGLDPRGVRGLADLARVPPTDWEELADDPAAFLLRPSEQEIARHGDRRLVLAVTWAKLRRRAERVNRDHIDPVYKPVHWHLEDGVPFGSSERDLDVLAEAGARMLSLAGLTRYDVLVGLTGPGPHLAHWQTVLGARRAQVTALHLGPRAGVDVTAAARPSVLAGDEAALRDVLGRTAAAGLTLPELHTLVVTGEWPDAGGRDALVLAAREVTETGLEPAVVAAWAPPGARALWAECREGPGLHTYPDLEVLEVDQGGTRYTPTGEGELLWSALGWHGTVVFRLRTGVVATVRDGQCPACGRKGPMVASRAREGVEEPLRALGEADDVTAFQIELRRLNGADEVLVFLSLHRDADLEATLHDVDRHVHAAQYVVLPRREVERRVGAVSSRVVDLR